MDVTQFPESIQCSLKKLVNAFAQIYDKDPTSLVTFLRQVIDLYDHDKKTFVDTFSQTEVKSTMAEVEEETQSPMWDLKSLAEDVKSVAEQTLKQSGFVYESSSGFYYNYEHQCYYIPENKLYYYVQNNAYYTFDEENNCMKLYSSTGTSQDQSTVTTGAPFEDDQKTDNSTDKTSEPDKSVDSASSPMETKTPDAVRSPRCSRVDDEVEEGEIVDDEDDDNSQPNSPQPVYATPTVICASPTKLDLNVEPEGHCAPCIRITVKECDSDKLEIGQLFIITRSGGSLGREGKHDIIIPDLNVSKDHLTFLYKYKDGKDVYEITDSSSKNGTILDGSSLKQNESCLIHHGSILKVGDTSLLCHIHDGTGTCNECEPSCLGFMTSPTSPSQAPLPSLKDRHTQEINQIKRKFGLKNNRSVPKLPKGYEDKSKIRRDTVGSSHESEKTDTQSTEVPINSSNKGYAMLAKMGWKEGEGVGKSGDGTRSPVNVTVKFSKRGLGCAEDDSMPRPKPRSKTKNLEITKKRYEACE